MYFSKQQLLAFGFDEIGERVKVSEKASIYSASGRIGDDTRIDDFTILKGRVEIGRKVHICSHCSLSAVGGEIVIDDLCGIGVGNIFYTASDDMLKSGLCGPLVDPAHVYTKTGTIKLARGVALGGRVTVFPGVRIGEFTAVGVSSTVINDLEGGCLYVTVSNKLRKVAKRDVSALTAMAEQELSG